MSILANITGSAAELLAEARPYGPFGVELGGLFEKATARELEIEGFGVVGQDCAQHGITACECEGDDITQVFMINDAGAAWLADAGKLV